MYWTPQAQDTPGEGPQCCEGERPVPLPARRQHLLQELQDGLKGAVQGVERPARHPAATIVEQIVVASRSFAECCCDLVQSRPDKVPCPVLLLHARSTQMMPHATKNDSLCVGFVPGVEGLCAIIGIRGQHLHRSLQQPECDWQNVLSCLLHRRTCICTTSTAACHGMKAHACNI